MKKEYDFSKMKIKKRGALAKPDAKVQKTIRLDLDVISWLVKEAGIRGVPYQTLINMTLKEAMNRSGEKPLKDLVRKVVREELKKAS